LKVIDEVLRILADGEWHNLNEISTKKPLLKLSTGKLLQVLEFLAEYEFLELSPDPKHIVEAKLTPLVQQFIKEIKWIERAEHL